MATCPAIIVAHQWIPSRLVTSVYGAGISNGLKLEQWANPVTSADTEYSKNHEKKELSMVLRFSRHVE
jgi:hypothetical protein|tara:strand:+ start:113 stop:316 length:204 start_codon:yes stop_codon:yes gene_type:complete